MPTIIKAHIHLFLHMLWYAPLKFVMLGFSVLLITQNCNQWSQNSINCNLRWHNNDVIILHFCQKSSKLTFNCISTTMMFVTFRLCNSGSYPDRFQVWYRKRERHYYRCISQALWWHVFFCRIWKLWVFQRWLWKSKQSQLHIVTILPTAIDQSHRIRKTMVCYFEDLIGLIIKFAAGGNSCFLIFRGDQGEI